MNPKSMLKRSHDNMEASSLSPIAHPGSSSDLAARVVLALSKEADFWRLPSRAQSRLDIDTAESSASIPVTCLVLFQCSPYRQAMKLVKASDATKARFIGRNGCKGSEIKVRHCCATVSDTS